MLKSLILISSVPFLACVGLQLFLESEKRKDMSYLKKQVIAGLVFGAIASFATQYGVPMDGAIINVRDAAPLCAGLFFGPLAGIISGVIGGVERWFSVYWLGGYYTRLACSISTILAGFIAALLRKKIFEDRKPDWTLALYAAAFCEVIHMIMIFMTNTDDIRSAFEYVRICTVPMVIINALSVAFSAFILRMMEKDMNGKKFVPTIAFQFQRSLIVLVFVSLFLTSTFTFLVQRQVAINDSFDIMFLNATDAYNDVMDQIRMEHLRVCKEVGEDYFVDLEDKGITWLANYYGVAEALIVNQNGTIINANHSELITRNIRDVEDLAKFSDLLAGSVKETAPYIEDFLYTPKSDLRYAGISLNDHLVICAYDKEQLYAQVDEKLDNMIRNRRIGEYGHIMVADKGGTIIADASGHKGEKTADLGLIEIDDNHRRDRRYSITINGERYYYMYTEEEYFNIYAFLPANESDLNNDISTYLNTFMLTIVLGVMFIVIYYLTRRHIVNNIDEVNESLDQITKGNLDTVVDVDVSEEFQSLSGGINLTVDALKELIRQANERIDSELRYAKEIQFSSLPTQFPPFPDRDEFDLYALMDPAREVGGDFYDFYMVGSHKLFFLVADVSGKGIPASLFMMRAKTIIRNYAEARISPGDILTNANYHLCEGNDANMFVTAWIGSLDLQTGELHYANAGHNPPLIAKKDGSYEYLTVKPGFVLAAMDNISYKEDTLMLEPGDAIFLYTDGVVEATNAEKELYGEDRLKDVLDRNRNKDAKETCIQVKEEVDAFYKGVDQFDDITELSLIFHKYKEKKN